MTDGYKCASCKISKTDDTKRLDWLDKTGIPNGIRFDNSSVFGFEKWRTKSKRDKDAMFTRKHKCLRSAIDAAMKSRAKAGKR